MWKTERKVELLAPAGSMEALRAAVQNGCDAVYLGGSMFGARAFANNFDADEIQEAIAYAMCMGFVCLLPSILIREEEFEDCVRYVQFLYEHDVDAVIIQDLAYSLCCTNASRTWSCMHPHRCISIIRREFALWSPAVPAEWWCQEKLR